MINNFSPPPVLAQSFNIDQQFFNQHANARNFAGNNLGQMASVLLPNFIVLAGMIFFLLIVYGGYILIIYGGQYNAPQRVAQSKNMVTYGLIGLLLVVAAYFILQLITQVTGVNFTNANIF
jgi:hypothetical protein